MEVYIINSKEEFHKYFSLLKDDAKTGSTPDTFLVGFDVEYIGKENYPQSFENCHNWVHDTPNNVACCLIQIATKNVCFLIHLPKIGKDLPKKLVNLLKNECWIKVGVGVELDLFHLSNNYRLGHCAGGIEVKNIASLANLSGNNMERLYGRLLSYPVKKTNSVCDWSINLTEDQIQYAIKDGIMSYDIFVKMIQPTIEYLKSLEDEKDKFNFTIINKSETLKIVDTPKKPQKVNYVGLLNEYAQENRLKLPEYVVDKKHIQGEPFKTWCYFGKKKEIGLGKSKIDSKQDVAMKVYLSLNK